MELEEDESKFVPKDPLKIFKSNSFQQIDIGGMMGLATNIEGSV